MTRLTAARPRVLRLVSTAGVAACLLTVGGCGGPSHADAKTAHDSKPKSPLEALFSGVTGNLDEVKVAEQQKKVEDIVASCMADQGFEYTPVDYSKLMSTQHDPVDTTTRAYAEKNGYGFSVMPDDAELSGLSSDFVDPNQGYVAAMSATEQQAYTEALYGKLDDLASGGSTDGPDLSQMGCYGKAQQEVNGAQQHAFESDELQTFSDDVDQLQKDIEADPSLTDLNAKWAACLSDAGAGDFASPKAAKDDFMQRASDTYDSAASADPTSTAVPTIDPKLQDEERKTAVADFDCRKKTGYDAAHQKVQFAAEQQFIDTHGPEIEAFKAAMKKAGL